MDSTHRPSPLSTNLLFLFLLSSTNLLTLFISTNFYSSCSLNPPPSAIAVTATAAATTTAPVIAASTTSDVPPEFLAFTSAQELPLGFNSNFDSDRIFPPVGQPCTLFPDELPRYMSYTVNGSCPDDELLAQKLLLKGCEQLPRRRCRPAAPPEYVEPYPLPACLWSTPSDSSVIWTAYTCKNCTSCQLPRRGLMIAKTVLTSKEERRLDGQDRTLVAELFH
ncbi:Apoptosis-inducing factor 1 like [Actinidia chinensis var. chinensis]|uniref:Apoptosis-inducing factor 1 like n=1 Tax=Actinidia chinensis var. chinensis TaxID=1590841 RepID=A0A2R6RJ60_ACTCC|nr:Apoptosis-inducing factor 1 like [Actinidia chinensis var. chinensis]